MGKHTETKEKSKNKKKKRKGLKVFLIIVVIFICIGIWFANRVNKLGGNWFAALLGHNEETLKNLEEIQVLLLGESQGMSDTIIACSYNPKTQKASMLSIPRDTYVGEGCSVYNKINSLYSNGETPEKTMEAVNEITGLDLKYYVIIDTEALVKLVDLIGGVEFYVPDDMNYDDNKQNLHIHLTEGLQTLTGKQAEAVARFRHNNDGSSYSYEYGNEDYGRMRTQRDLIVAVAKQTIKLKNIKEIGNIIDIMKEDIKTNMNISSLIDYVPYAVNINFDSIQTAQLPGESSNKNTYGIWFFYHDKEETVEVVDKLFGEEEIKAEEELENNVAVNE